MDLGSHGSIQSTPAITDCDRLFERARNANDLRLGGKVRQQFRGQVLVHAYAYHASQCA
jgi:hypothetical protein